MDAFWAAVNRPKLAPKKTKFRQKKLYLTTVDVEDVESSSLLKMLPKDLHRFQNASEAIQGFKLYRYFGPRIFWATVSILTPVALLLLWQGPALFPTRSEQKMFAAYMGFICMQNLSLANLFRDHMTIEAIEETVLRGADDQQCEDLQDLVRLAPERVVLDEVDVDWLTPVEYGNFWFVARLLSFALVYCIAVSEILLDPGDFEWEWRAFGLVICTWIAYGSLICGKVLRDGDDCRLWDELPQHVRREKIDFMITMSRGQVIFRVMTWVCFIGATIITLYFLIMWDIDQYDRLLYLVGYVFAINTSMTLSKMIHERVVSARKVSIALHAQQDLCVVATLIFAVVLLFAYVANGGLPRPKRFLLGTTSALGLVAAMGPGVVHSTDDVDPTEELKKERAAHPPTPLRHEPSSPRAPAPRAKGKRHATIGRFFAGMKRATTVPGARGTTAPGATKPAGDRRPAAATSGDERSSPRTPLRGEEIRL
jgi:hypothetical protein